MVALAKIFIVAATVVTFVSAHTYKKCHKEGERCIGAPGFPAVPYLGCCDDMSCSAKDTSYGGYGLVCSKKDSESKQYEPKYEPKSEPKYEPKNKQEPGKCYKEGERCIGAPGMPAVPYLGCCDDMSCTAKDTSYEGYGLVCAKKGYKPEPESPKCYKEGERCIGAPGKPAVPYLGCCEGMSCTAKDASYEGYGLVCAKKGYKPEPESPNGYKPEPESPKGYKPEPESPKDYKPEPESPKDYKPEPESPKGYKPEPESPKGYKPEPESPKGYKPEPESPNGYKPEPESPNGYKPKPESPKCYKENERCIGAPGKPAVPYLGCCDGMECTGKDTTYDGYGKVCVKKGYKSPPPTSY